ncbi:MAG TPA: phospholipid carrier-dependent glycosyltransferase [Candidatus Binataceae bacterium]|nr:phospholipid carrier-dependent glycosyltransferase [Candidatus Binataceae bacterium]
MTLSRRALRIALVFAFAVVLYLPGLGRPALWEPDEGRYAEIAREMHLSGDFVTPRNDQVRYFEKPPLVYWAETAAIAVFGANEFAIRLPAAICSIAEIVGTAMLAEAMFGADAALLSAIALGLGPLFFGLGRAATLDPALAFFMTAGLGAFFMAALIRDFSRTDARRLFVVAAAMLAMGTLAKGPVALLLGGAIALAWIIVERRTNEIVRMPWLPAIAVYAAITIPWFALAEWRNPGFLSFFFLHEHFARYLHASEHGWGMWFFIPVVIFGAWPWIVFAPVGMREMARDSSTRSVLKFLAIWFAFTFVFFSIPRAKLASYILPAMPALAILCGYGIARLWSMPSDRARRILTWFVLLNVVAVVGAAAGLFAARGFLSPELTVDGIVILSLLALMTIAVWILRGASVGPSIVAIALTMIVIVGLGTRAREHAAAYATYRNLARAIAPLLRPGCVLASYRHNVQSLPFYTGFRERLVAYRGELDEPFSYSPDAAESFIATDDDLRREWAGGGCVMLVANRSDLGHLRTILTPTPVTVGCEGKKLALYNGDAPQNSACASAGDAD